MPNQTKTPTFRRLRGYAFDPSLSLQMDTAQVNNLVYKVEWETLDEVDNVSVPRGEYIEIVDYDPSTGLFYPPVDMNDFYQTAQDGLAPSVSNPQFHQQMVYAVIMTTIKNFEKALGRRIQWGEDIVAATTRPAQGKQNYQFKFVQRLRVYPHALRQANAYYNPYKKALLFGYFPSAGAPNLQLPGGMIFTCLSHDIIAHETTHAILDGLHRRYIDPTHPDTRAFHEAFADIVALFQHFTFPEVLRHQIAKTRGNLEDQNLLGQLALQFGVAMGNYGSLRDAIGEYDKEGNWKLKKPNPDDYDKTIDDMHARGSILVAAIFEAFLSVYKERVKSLLRIATGGTGKLPDGEIHPDLTERLASAAAKTAEEILRICIRSLDYCPHTDITFGDYLRAIITSDIDAEQEDSRNYRVAFIEAFQKRGIFPEGLRSMSVEELAYEQYPEKLDSTQSDTLGSLLRDFKNKIGYITDREELYEETKKYIGGSKETKMGIHAFLNYKFIQKNPAAFSALSGLLFPGGEIECNKAGLEYSPTTKVARFEISNMWLANRVTPQGKILNHVIITLAQKRGVSFIVKDDEITVDEKGYFVPEHGSPPTPYNTVVRGGCTLIFDLDTLRLRYAVKKDINDHNRMIRQFRYMNGMMNENEADNTYFDNNTLTQLSGPFAFMHSHKH